MQGRVTKNINLGWKFKRHEDEQAYYMGLNDSDWRDITLPHDWAVEEEFSKEHSSGTGYLPGGIGWYRKHLVISEDLEDKKVTLNFDGVYNNSQVWVNSYYLGKRPYGYSAFSHDITPFVRTDGSENVISVKVNHKDIADSRWYTGSGIYRDVTLTITEMVHVDRYGVFPTTVCADEKSATISVDVNVANDTCCKKDITIINTLCDGSKAQSVITVNGDATGTVTQKIEVNSPELWSPDEPNLYELTTQVLVGENIVDVVVTPVGIRTFAFDANKGFSLNGVNMKMKGVCIHHDAGCLGGAVPQKVWRRRFEALKEMGCNAIRSAHNPPAANLLDLCDSMGFLVMDEAFDEWEGPKNKWSTGHNVYPPKHFGYFEDFHAWHEADIKEMVLRDRNHPSIIMWSIGNEVDYPNDPYCYPYIELTTGNNDANKPIAERMYDPKKPEAKRLATIAVDLVKHVKECDTSRPITAAWAFPEVSNLTGYADPLDVVGYNYKEHMYANDHTSYPDRVIYGSENGSGIDQWLAVRDNDYISGQFIWTGIDYLGEAKGWPVRVAMAGFIDLAGHRKPRYYYRKSLWSDAPVLHLSATGDAQNSISNEYARYLGVTSWDWSENEDVNVICYTNCVEVELFLNGESIGSKKLADCPKYFMQWDMKYVSGELKAIGKNGDGTIEECILATSGDVAKLAMCCDAVKLPASGLDVAHIEIEVVDENGILVIGCDKDILVTVEGEGELLGLENGNYMDLTPYSSPSRKPFNGKLLAIVRTTTSAGGLTIKAEAQGVAPSTVVINTI